MQTIKLGSKVVVSDPCYKIPTWCQVVIKNVLPGNYKTIVKKSDKGDWGLRCSVLYAIHEDHVLRSRKEMNWKEDPADIGVDSGQAGIFSFDTYRNNTYSDQIPGNPDPFGDGVDDVKQEDRWYYKMCNFTLSEHGWGTYPEGVVSSSGCGDGSYVLHTAKVKRKIVGFILNFFMEPIIDFNFLNKQQLELGHVL